MVHISRASKILFFLAYLAVAALLIFSWDDSQEQDREIRDTIELIEQQRVQRVKQINESNFDLCQEVESLKKQERAEAIESRKRLDETLRLLKLEKTKEIVDTANRNKFEKLKRFAPEACPRKVITSGKQEAEDAEAVRTRRTGEDRTRADRRQEEDSVADPQP